MAAIGSSPASLPTVNDSASPLPLAAYQANALNQYTSVSTNALTYGVNDNLARFPDPLSRSMSFCVQTELTGDGGGRFPAPRNQAQISISLRGRLW